jgi:signal transduction histidine kinase
MTLTPRRTAALMGALVTAGVLLRLASFDLVNANPLFHPHGYCYLWLPNLVSAHVVSDALIALSYLSISLTLSYLVWRAQDAIPFRWMFLAFGLFIVACGATHVMEILTLWKPWFWMSADVKIVTALASVTTAIALPPLVPQIVTLARTAHVSEQRRVALEQMHGELERRVADRTAELRQAQDELFQAQKMESVGRLAAGIAHDFNNLLMVINGCTELAGERHGLDDTTRGLLRNVSEAGARAASLTGQFLAFGRKQTLQPKLLDLNALVTAIIDMLRRLITENITLTCVLAPTPVLVLADPTQIEQVIVNLVINARDAMPMGGEVTIATSRADIELDETKPGEVGSYSVLSIRDTGQGMDESLRANIFEPYFTTKAVGKGSGLGLSTVYGIAKQSGGLVRVVSEPGVGSTFQVYLPRLEEIVTVTEPIVRAAEQRDGGSETVLLVEDEESVRSFVARILRRTGYTVLEASGPAAAVDVFESRGGAIDIVVSDVVMPDMDGPTLVARLMDIKPGFLVLFMSGYPGEDSRTLSGYDFIQKPFTPAGLAQRVRNVLDSQHRKD